MNVWIAFLLIGVFTYLTRLSFILLFERIDVPASVLRALRFVPPAVLSAIIFPEVLMHDGALDLSLHNGRMIAGLLAAVVAWRTKNIFLTLLAGMMVLLLIQFVLVSWV